MPPAGPDCRAATGTKQKDYPTGEVEQSEGVPVKGARGGPSERRCHRYHGVILGVLFTPDAESVKSIRPVGAVLKTVFLSLPEFLAALVLATVVDPGGLNRDEQVLVVLPVDHRHQLGLPGKHAVDKEMLDQMVHGGTDVDLGDKPSVRTESVDYDRPECLVIDRISPLLGGVVEIKDDTAVAVVAVIFAKIVYKLVELAFIFDIERFKHKQLVGLWLPGHAPVDVGIVVKSHAQRLLRIHVGIHEARRVLELFKVILALVYVRKVGSRIFVPLSHRGVKPVAGDTDALAQDGSLERQRGQVAFKLPDELLPQYDHVVNRRYFPVINGHRPQLAQRAMQPPEFAAEVAWRFYAFLPHVGDTDLDCADLEYERPDKGDYLGVSLFVIIEEPRAFLRHRHVGRNQHRVMKEMLTEILAVAAQGLKRLVLELFKVYKLGLVDIERVVRLRVGRTGAVLRDYVPDRTVVERQDVFVVLHRENRLFPPPSLGGLYADGPVYISFKAPAFPVDEHRGERVDEGPFDIGRDKTCNRSGHTLEIAPVPKCVNHPLAECAAGHKDSVLGLNDRHKVTLHVIQINLLMLSLHSVSILD